MEAGVALYSIFSILGFVLYAAATTFVVCVVLIVLKRMRERNEYLKDIRDELRKRSNTSN
ncbi:hypothetical protein M3215_00635 [Bacillus cytotoxicus]|uniref:Uncharacterized protein n=1 Tax=Bacillus cytotoxicus TaxID=580165 RepID=A0ACC6A0H7_9BACI|nr:hypothetical protein [Bacillus cytotoxicus]